MQRNFLLWFLRFDFFKSIVGKSAMARPENVIPLVDLEIARMCLLMARRSTKIWTFVAWQPVLQWSASLFRLNTQRSSLLRFQVLIIVHVAVKSLQYRALCLGCYRVHLYIDCQAALTILKYLCDCHYCNITPKIQDHHDLWERVWVQIRSRPPVPLCMIDATKTKAHTEVDSIDDPLLKWQAMANNAVDS